jgi:hypothetical protein
MSTSGASAGQWATSGTRCRLTQRGRELRRAIDLRRWALYDGQATPASTN